MARRDFHVALSSSIQTPAFCITWRPGVAGRNFCEPSTLFHNACRPSASHRKWLPRSGWTFRTCSWEFHIAVRSATELRLSLLLSVGGKLSSKPDGSGPVSEDADLRAVVLDFSSDIKFRSARISPFNFSASLLILINCVLFW